MTATNERSDHPAAQQFRKARVTRTVPLISDPEAAERLEDLKHQLGRAEMMVAGDQSSSNIAFRDSLQKKYEDLKAEVLADATLVKLGSIGFKKYDRLIRDHPATEEQIAEMKDLKERGVMDKDADLPYNPETFGTALIRKCIITPELSDEEWDDFVEDLTMGEMQLLFATCVAINTTSMRLDLGKG